MMKSKILTWSAAIFTLCAMMTISACSSDKNEDGSGVVPPPQETDATPGTVKMANFYGVVTRCSNYGSPSPFKGVKVTSGDQTVLTDANGFYQFDRVNVVNGRAVLKFEKEGFMTVVRSVTMQDDTRLDMAMKECLTETFSSVNNKNIELPAINASRKMRIELPADAYVTENGSAYSGTVTAEVVYLDPDDSNFPVEMPGDLSAIRLDESPAQLISYGMVAVELKGDVGQKLNLAPGKKAVVIFPIPERLKDNTPSFIPLWSFNEETGLWEEEGSAERYGGDYYRGEVSHFSWHNLDSPELKATVKLTVVDANGKALKRVPVDIGGQRLLYTDDNGKLKCDIPSNTDVYFRIPSENYGNYAGNDLTKEAKTTVNLNGGEERDITLTVTTSCIVIKGKVTNTGGGSNICSLVLSYFTSEDWWKQTSSVISDMYGNYEIYAPSGISGPAQLIATFADGNTYAHDFTLTGADQVVNFSFSSQSSAKTGVVKIVNEALGINNTYYLPVPESGNYWETAVITGTHFHADMSDNNKGNIDWESGETIDMISFNTNEYATGQSHVNKATFFWMREGGPHLRIEASDQPADITKNGDIYTVKMTNVKGTFEDQMKNFDYVEVKLSVEFTVKAAPKS